MYDFIVIGAGYSGLTTAALLAKEKKKILVLESHNVIGGCASYYKRKEFLFDVGATTFSGVKQNQPVGKIFELLDIKPKFKKLDPGMVIIQNEKKINRYSDQYQWINEAENKFGSSGQNKFWEKVYRINDEVYNLISSPITFPPSRIKDYFHLINFKNIKRISLLNSLTSSVEKVLNELDLSSNKQFASFIDEQLLITTQNNRFDTPFLMAAMGLAYPSETYYPYGGMYKPLEVVQNSLRLNEGELKFKEKVTSIEFNKEYNIKTERGNTYKAKGVISSIPIWNLELITDGPIKNYFSNYSRRFNKAWGAVTLNFAIESNHQLETAYYQIHLNKRIPFCEGNSIFVSFSLDDDIERAPIGWRAVTISIHTNPNDWLNLTKEKYLERKGIVTEQILESFQRAFPELSSSEIKHQLTGTPQTFNFYTQRHNGYVGGIPHSLQNNFFSLPKNKTPFKNFYTVGDTTFPGQGIPAVIWGALNCSSIILNS